MPCHLYQADALVSTDNDPRETDDDVLAALKNFDVADSHCYDPNEEVKLRTVINAVGGE